MEYKRERNMLETRVEELEKKSTYHDDHLRVIDAWWDQVRPSFELFPLEFMAEFLTHSCSTKSDYLPINLIMPVGVILMEVSFTGVLLTRERSTKN